MIDVDDTTCDTCGQPAAYVGYGNYGPLFACADQHVTCRDDEL